MAEIDYYCKMAGHKLIKSYTHLSIATVERKLLQNKLYRQLTCKSGIGDVAQPCRVMRQHRVDSPKGQKHTLTPAYI